MEKELEDHYERITGKRPKITIEDHEDPTRLTMHPSEDGILIKRGKGYDPDKASKSIRTGVLMHARDTSFADLDKKFGGTIDRTGIKDYSRKNLEQLYRDKLHGGVSLQLKGEHSKEVEDQLHSHLTDILSKLSKENRDKLKGLKIISHSENSPELGKLLSRIRGKGTSEDKALVKGMFEKVRGFVAGADEKNKAIYFIRPEQGKSYLKKHLAHEIYHLIDDPKVALSPFTKKGLTPYAEKYKDPLQRSRESMAELFGGLHSFLGVTKETHPSRQIVKYIEKVLPKSRTPKDTQFKLYLIRKLHTLQGLKLPNIRIKGN